jgi:mono/diheme cytochrome c family protein
MTRVAQYVTATIPALAILGFFVWFANWIPQTSWEPPQKLAISAGAAPAQLASIGDTIVRERGCMACHTIEPGVGVEGGGRGPNWADLAVRRAQGVPGGPDNLTEYLAQALFEPSAYLVDGFADIMPAATDAPAKLTYEETVAAINYLQTMGGTPSVRLGDIPRPAAAAAAPSAETPTDPAALFATFKCAACHSLAAGEVRVGPTLDTASLRRAAADRGTSAEAYIMESIVDPAAFEGEGFPSGVMPPDFGTQLTAGQLQALVNYLLPAGGE